MCVANNGETNSKISRVTNETKSNKKVFKLIASRLNALNLSVHVCVFVHSFISFLIKWNYMYSSFQVSELISVGVWVLIDKAIFA